jgi:hypothetical protein
VGVCDYMCVCVSVCLSVISFCSICLCFYLGACFPCICGVCLCPCTYVCVFFVRECVLVKCVYINRVRVSMRVCVWGRGVCLCFDVEEFRMFFCPML